MFQLTTKEFDDLRYQSGTSNLKSQFGTSRWGGRRYPPYAFTEQGVAMLSSVLHSDRAVHVNIEIMRAFVRLPQLLASNTELARKLAALERKYDAQFKVVFDAIRALHGRSNAAKGMVVPCASSTLARSNLQAAFLVLQHKTEPC